MISTDLSTAYAVDVFVGPNDTFAIAVRVPAWHDGAAQWVVWCPYCGGLHRHGRTLNDSLHRLGHCVYAEPASYCLTPIPGQHPKQRPTVLAGVALDARRARNALRSGRRVSFQALEGPDANT
jgi:hypothetical protein